jgi:NitT/TauT family transport system permease protein
VVASLFRVTWGYLLGVAVAVPLGLMLGWYRRGERTITPLIRIFRPISPLAWIPFSILWFGLDDRAPIFLIFTATFLPMTECAINAVKNVSTVHLNAGRNFGLSQRELILRVLYPAVAPQLIIGLRISSGIAWLVVVAAEMIAVNSGLGFLIIDARNAGNRYDLVVAGMVLIGMIGFALDTMMKNLEQFRAFSWSKGIR